MTPNERRDDHAAIYVMRTKREGQGPCLVPKPGREAPSCHENDFCECEVMAAYVAGHQDGWSARDSEVSELVEALEQVQGSYCDCWVIHEEDGSHTPLTCPACTAEAALRRHRESK